MKYRVTHNTTYHGDQPVSVCHNEAWLKPRNTQFQQLDDHQLEIHPSPTSLAPRRDYFGNNVWAFSFNRGYDKMTVTSINEVTLRELTIPPVDQTLPWEQVADRLRSPASPDDLAGCEFTFDSPRICGTMPLEEYARQSFPAGRPLLAGAAELTERIHTDFEFDSRATTVTTPVDEVFQLRKGVCQDFAHLEIAALRSLGLAARYVSGYLRTRPAPGKPHLVGTDASHAWLSVYLGEGHWCDLDPTNNLFPNLEHITVAWGRDYGDVCPLKGVFIGGGGHSLSVSVDVALITPDDPHPSR
jgi:transglutaminase-like putative cysteine protease